MWEYRRTWPAAPPDWWNDAWRRGLASLVAHGREVEERPDTYVALPDRDDVGVKRRRGEARDVEVKVRHRRSDGWELWEKIAFFRWDELELLRCCALLQLPPPVDLRVAGQPTPAEGTDELLRSLGLHPSVVVVGKKRLQIAARELLPAWPGSSADPGWLAEMAEIALPGRPRPLYSVCLEAMTPAGGELIPSPGGLTCGYPELLQRHLRGSLDVD